MSDFFAQQVLNPKGSGDEKYIGVDRWNRYMLPHPLTGEPQGWTRATTVTKTLEDGYHLGKWAERMVAYGIATNPHLAMQAASYSPNDLADGNVKRDLNEIAERAKQAAGSEKSSRVGTGLHNFTDRIDRGEKVDYVPPPYDRDVAGYVNLMSRSGCRPVPQYIERIVVHDELGIAGKLDRLLSCVWSPETLKVGDLKSQQSLDFSAMSIPMQLAFYARAPWLWNVTEQRYENPPPRDLKLAIVMHVPSGGSGVADLIFVDLEKGWELLLLAMQVRAARKTDGTLVKADLDVLARLVGESQPSALALAASAVEKVDEVKLEDVEPPEHTDAEMAIVEEIGKCITVQDLIDLRSGVADEHWGSAAQNAAASRWEFLSKEVVE